MITDRLSKFGSTLIIFGALMFVGSQIYNMLDQMGHVQHPENYSLMISGEYSDMWWIVIVIGFIIWLAVLIIDIIEKRKTKE